MIENIGAYSQVDYDRGYKQGRADGFQQGVDDTTKRYKDSYMARDIEQIRADAIEPIKAIMQESEKKMWCADKTLKKIEEQLKEQKE